MTLVTAYRVNNMDEVQKVVGIQTNLSECSVAEHNIVACRINGESFFDDDREHTAGERLGKLIEENHLDNVVVIVSRWYPERKHIGPIRHTLIRECATEALSALTGKQLNKLTKLPTDHPLRSDEPWSTVSRKHKQPSKYRKDILLLTDSLGNKLTPHKLARVPIDKADKVNTFKIKETTQVLQRKAETMYKDIVIVVGSNDLVHCNNPWDIEKDYEAMLRTAKTLYPSSSIHIVEILPRKGIELNTVRTFNRHMYEVAKMVGVKVIKPHESFLNNRRLLQDDCIHPNADGVKVLAHLIINALHPERPVGRYNQSLGPRHSDHQSSKPSVGVQGATTDTTTLAQGAHTAPPPVLQSAPNSFSEISPVYPRQSITPYATTDTTTLAQGAQTAPPPVLQSAPNSFSEISPVYPRQSLTPYATPPLPGSQWALMRNLEMLQSYQNNNQANINSGFMSPQLRYVPVPWGQ